MTEQAIEKLLENVAGKNGITVEEVRKAIHHAINLGMENQDISVREKWSHIPYKGECLTENDVIIYLINKEHHLISETSL